MSYDMEKSIKDIVQKKRLKKWKENGVMAFYRKYESMCVLVAANFGMEPVEIELEYTVKKVLLSNRINETTNDASKTINLNSCDVVVLEMER